MPTRDTRTRVVAFVQGPPTTLGSQLCACIAPLRQLRSLGQLSSPTLIAAERQSALCIHLSSLCRDVSPVALDQVKPTVIDV